MRVSIITVCYNSEATIGRTMRSIQQQSYGNIEHIIVDGSSTDKTLSIIKELQHNGPLKSEPDKGIYDAMNKGIAMATGDIIGILNSDDYYSDNNVIERIVNTFSASNCNAVYGDLLYVNSKNESEVLRKWVAGGYDARLFYRGWMPPHPTFFVKREMYEKLGCFNLKLKSSSDYELMLRFLFLHDIKAKYIPQVLVHMQDGGQSNKSLKNRFAAHKEDYMAWTANGLKPKWYTLILKPTRKIHQFVFFKRKMFNAPKDLNKSEPKERFSTQLNLRNSL
ncbi:MAG: glycosyltransferase [Segetibacter sp.]|nr:glycosyltransferase [Segetibacter sp.]